MAREVDLAGEFIYAGLEKMNSMNSIDEPSEAFFVLYHLAIGIERLQKVLLVLVNDIQPNDMENFLKGIKHHNHGELSAEIKKHIKINFSKEQNAFLQVLADFYEKRRYDKYDFFSYDMEALNNLSKFLKDNYPDYERCYSQLSDRHSINENIKEYMGRIVGKICQKYYSEIHRISFERNIYSYELRVGTPAYKIFMTNDAKASYQKELDKEKYAIKELLIFLHNSKKTNSFFRFIKSVKPLDFDIALVEGYIRDLCKKNVSTDLIDEVEYHWYETDAFSKEELERRKEMLDVIGSDETAFDMYDDMNLVQRIWLKLKYRLS